MVVAFSTKKVVNKKERKRSDSKGIFFTAKASQGATSQERTFPQSFSFEILRSWRKKFGGTTGARFWT